jgi:hypothetical protein
MGQLIPAISKVVTAATSSGVLTTSDTTQIWPGQIGFLTKSAVVTKKIQVTEVISTISFRARELFEGTIVAPLNAFADLSAFNGGSATFYADSQVVGTNADGGKLGSVITDFKPILIDSKPLVGATSYQLLIGANAYRELQFYIKATGGCQSGAPAFMRFNGDSGAAAYSHAGSAIQGGAHVQFPVQGTNSSINIAVSGIASPVTSLDCRVVVRPLVVSGVRRAVFSDCVVREASGSLILPFRIYGIWDDPTSPITQADITFGTAATGTLEVWGIAA